MNRNTGIAGLSVIGCIRLFIVVLLVAGFGVAQHDDENKRNAHDTVIGLQGHDAASTYAPSRQNSVDHTCSPISACVPILLASWAILRAALVRPQPVTRSHVHKIDLWRARPASPIPIIAS